MSAKYRGAFCEAKIKTAKRLVKAKVSSHDSNLKIDALPLLCVRFDAAGQGAPVMCDHTAQLCCISEAARPYGRYVVLSFPLETSLVERL